MSSVETSELIRAITTLLTEAYAGPPDPRETWFVDNQPDAGVLGLLSGISAEEASRSVDGSGKSGSTIAAQVEHLRWSMANANGAMRGETYSPDWNESWKLIQTDPQAWDRLRSELRQEFETMREALSRQPDLPGPYLTGVMALIPHAAFHLGLMRQMIERIRA